MVRLRWPDGIAGLRSLATSGFAALGPLLAAEGGDGGGGAGQWRPAALDWLLGLELQVWAPGLARQKENEEFWSLRLHWFYTCFDM